MTAARGVVRRHRTASASYRGGVGRETNPSVWWGEEEEMGRSRKRGDAGGLGL